MWLGWGCALHLGSSPRMRGTPTDTAREPPGAGLIPTYAGNTLVRPRSAHPARAHPHVCGEHSGECETSPIFQGSSPRMRGTRQRYWPGSPRSGLIPTYAGNTKGANSAGVLTRAHPHVCGEHAIEVVAAVFTWGSSPRMRGTHVARLRNVRVAGLIPTYAGNTCCRIRSG